MHAFQGDIFDKGEWVLEFLSYFRIFPQKSKFMMYVLHAYFQECYHTYRKCSNIIWLIFPLFSRHGLKTKSHAVLKETKTVRIIKVWKNYVCILISE